MIITLRSVAGNFRVTSDSNPVSQNDEQQKNEKISLETDHNLCNSVSLESFFAVIIFNLLKKLVSKQFFLWTIIGSLVSVITEYCTSLLILDLLISSLF